MHARALTLSLSGGAVRDKGVNCVRMDTSDTRLGCQLGTGAGDQAPLILSSQACESRICPTEPYSIYSLHSFVGVAL